MVLVVCLRIHKCDVTVPSHLKRHAGANTGHEQIYPFLKAIFSISIVLYCGNYGEEFYSERPRSNTKSDADMSGDEVGGV